MPSLHSTLNVGEGAASAQSLLIDPREVVVDLTQRGRKFPPTQDEIVNLAEKILSEGQLEEVLFNKLPDKRVKLVFGFTRWEAAMWIVNNHPDRNFRLRGRVVTCSPEEAIRYNISENHDRKQTSVIDDAYNQRRLRDELGKTNEEIAAQYKCTPSWVIQIANLLMYPEEIQRKIHDNMFGVSSALKLIHPDVSEEERNEIILKATDGKGKIRGPKVTELLRDLFIQKNPEAELEDSEDDEEDWSALGAKLAAGSAGGLPPVAAAGGEVAASGSEAASEDSTETEEKPTKKKTRGRAARNSESRSAKNLRTFIEENTGPAEDPANREFLKKLGQWIDGKVSDKVLVNALNKHLEAQPKPAEEPTKEEAAAAAT